jgi:alpha-tubulin suppressor-like RCC1 family protein
MDAYDTDQLPRAVPLPLPAVDVVAAWQLTCATLSDASVWCWGLAAPGEPTHLAPDSWRISDVRTIVAGASHFCALKNDGSVWCWGHDDSGQDGAGAERNSGTETPHQVLGLASDVTQIAAGNAHTCARKSDATIWCWGDGQYGQIGNDQAFNVRPVQMLGCE